MLPERAYRAAWSGVESDVRAWVKAYKPGVPSLTLAFADIQARFADSLREDLTDLDVFTRERVVIASLKALRDALSTVGLVPDTTSVTKAKEAVAMSALGATSVVADQQHQDERQAAMDDLVSGDALTWKWKARLDSRTCLFCLSRHGTEHPLGTPMLSHPNCRCRPVPPDTDLADGLEWMRNRSPKTMRKMLGPGRTKLVEQGVPLEDLVDEHRHGVRPIRDFRGVLAKATKGFGGPPPSAGNPTMTKVMPRVELGGEFDPKQFQGGSMTEDDVGDTVFVALDGAFHLLLKTFKAGSAWNGTVYIDDEFPTDTDGNPVWSGLKTWDCPIAIHPKSMFRGRPFPIMVDFERDGTTTQEFLDFDLDLYDTVLHEMVHSFSAMAAPHPVGGPPVSFNEGQGIEEGCAALLTQERFPKFINLIIKDVGITGAYQVKMLREAARDHQLKTPVYSDWVSDLRELASYLDMDPALFAEWMLQTPPDERITDLASSLLDAGWEPPEEMAADDPLDAISVWLYNVFGQSYAARQQMFGGRWETENVDWDDVLGKPAIPEPVITDKPSFGGFEVRIGDAYMLVKQPRPEYGHGPEARVGWVGVPPELQRQGIATRLYALAAAEAQRRYGAPLRSDYANVTPEAEAVWKALVAKGLARYVGPLEGKDFGEYEYL